MAYELSIEWEDLDEVFVDDVYGDDVFIDKQDCEYELPDDIDDELRENGFKYDEETGMYNVIPKMLVLF
jgi:hypothetical protein